MNKRTRFICLLAAVSIFLQMPAIAVEPEAEGSENLWMADIGASSSSSEPNLLSSAQTSLSVPVPVSIPVAVTSQSDKQETNPVDCINPASSPATASDLLQEKSAIESERAASETAEKPVAEKQDVTGEGNKDGLFSVPLIASGDGLLAERIGFDESPVGNFEQIDLLSKQVILKEIELMKLNTRYRIESTRVGKWKPWRQFAYGLAANTLIEVGISHIAYARWKYWQRPGLATKAFLRKGPQCLLIGHAIVVGGILIETGFDLLAQHQQNKKGFNRKTCRNRVVALKGEIDQLIKSRDAAVQNTPMNPAQSEVLKVEGKVLSDMKDCAVGEFARLATRERKLKTARDVANVFSFAQASTGGFIGSLGNLLAVANRKPRLASPAGMGFVISGAFIVLTPPAAKIFSIIAANREKKIGGSILGVNKDAMANLDASRTALSSALVSSAGSLDSVKTRLDIYAKQKEILDKQVQMGKNEAKLNNKEFVEKCITNGIAGGTKISWGINLIVAGSDFSNTAPKAAPTRAVVINRRTFRVPLYKVPKTPAQMFSRRVAWGATSNIAGPAVGGIDVIQSRFRGEMRARKAKKNGTAPGQLLAARMKALEEMEAKLK